MHPTCATHIPGTPVGHDLEPCRKRIRLRPSEVQSVGARLEV